jgi:hypothetical protein
LLIAVCMNKSMSKIVRFAAGRLPFTPVSIATATRVSLLVARTNSELAKRVRSRSRNCRVRP